jgi:hypothetical protein
VKDFVVATHWEDFDWPLGGSASAEEFSCGDESVLHAFGGDYIKVIDYIQARERIIGRDACKHFYVLGRAGFEWPYPQSPNKLREELWADPLIDSFKDVGPWRGTPEHLAALTVTLKDVLLKKKEPIELLRELAKMQQFSLVLGATLTIIEIVLMIQYAASLKSKDEMEEGESEEGTWAQYDSYKEIMPVIRRITGQTLGQLSGGFI